MPIIKPTEPDYVIETGDSLVTVDVPRPRLFMVFSLASALVGIVYLISFLSDLAYLRTDSALMAFNAFIVVWAFFWTIYMGMLATVGREVIQISQRSIVIGNKIFIEDVVLPTAPSKEYLTEHIKNLRTWPALGWGGGGSLAFDYGAKTVRFAAGIDEAEAGQILKELKASLPWLPCV